MLALHLLAASVIFPRAHAAHGLDNNWTVKVNGMVDANSCVRVTSIEDMGTNIATGATSRCVPGTDTCEDGYSCDAARARKPGSFSGCTFDSSTASESSVTGVLMDGTCYNNFIVKQLVVNGNPKTPGLAPDLVHVRSEAHLHTRACLVVNYCSASGFYLLQSTGEAGNLTYSFLAHMEQGSSTEMVFDWLVEARHPCGTTTTTIPAGTSHAYGRGGIQWLSIATTLTAFIRLRY